MKAVQAHLFARTTCQSHTLVLLAEGHAHDAKNLNLNECLNVTLYTLKCLNLMLLCIH